MGSLLTSTTVTIRKSRKTVVHFFGFVLLLVLLLLPIFMYIWHIKLKFIVAATYWFVYITRSNVHCLCPNRIGIYKKNNTRQQYNEKKNKHQHTKMHKFVCVWHKFCGNTLQLPPTDWQINNTNKKRTQTTFTHTERQQ